MRRTMAATLKVFVSTGLTVVLLAGSAGAQIATHGVTPQKGCLGPSACIGGTGGTSGLPCSSAAQCPGGTCGVGCVGGSRAGQAGCSSCPGGTCTATGCLGGPAAGQPCCPGGTCLPGEKARPGDPYTCTITIANADSRVGLVGDDVRIASITDCNHSQGDPPGAVTCGSTTGNLLPGMAMCSGSGTPCTTHGECASGRCPIGPFCTGALTNLSDIDKPCSVPADCPGGTCSPNPSCLGGSQAGLACSSQAQCPGGQCVVVLPQRGDAVRVSNTDTALASDLGTTVTDKAPYTCVDTLVGDCSGTASGILNVVECLTNADCGTCADCESCAECVNNTCGPRQAGFECRPSACNPADPSCCDVPEQCDGGSKTCPANMFAPASKVCRFKSAECDREERCSSTSVTCPADQKEMPGTPCADDGDVCTDDVCTCTDASCVNLTCRHPGNDVCVGCRLTGGGAVMPNNVDRTTLAAITKANFGGQVGAPCGCVGCNTNVEGSWTHNRKTKAGSFKATTFTSLACGCEVPNGALCDRAGNPDTPADVFCSSGVGQLKESGVSKTVVFRLEAVDHGEPGIGDSYRLRMWVPQTGKQSELADAVCCGKVDPKVTTSLYKSVIDDGGPLTSGNIQIHKQLRKSSDGICPPKTTCPVR